MPSISPNSRSPIGSPREASGDSQPRAEADVGNRSRSTHRTAAQANRNQALPPRSNHPPARTASASGMAPRQPSPQATARSGLSADPSHGVTAVQATDQARAAGPALPMERLAQTRRAHGDGVHQLRQGVPAAQVIANLSIASPHLQNDLKQMAALMNSPVAADRRCASQLTLSTETQEGRTALRGLQARVINGPAAHAVMAGQPVDQVAERMGLDGTRSLEQIQQIHEFSQDPSNAHISARVAARLHAVLQEVTEGGQQNRQRLEALFTDTCGVAAVHSNHPPDSVAERLGIRDPRQVHRLHAEVPPEVNLAGQTTPDSSPRIGSRGPLSTQSSDVDLR